MNPRSLVLTPALAGLAILTLPRMLHADPCCGARHDRFEEDRAEVGCHNSYGTELAQSFTPGTAFTLCAVRLKLHGESPGVATVSIEDVPSGSGTVLSEAIVTGVVAYEPTWYDVDLPDIELDAGQTYFIRVRSDIGSSVQWCNYQGFSGDPYPGGCAYFNGDCWDSDSWWIDFWFITFGPGSCSACCVGEVCQLQPTYGDCHRLGGEWHYGMSCDGELCANTPIVKHSWGSVKAVYR